MRPTRYTKHARCGTASLPLSPHSGWKAKKAEAKKDARAHRGIEGRIEAELAHQAKPATALEFQSLAPVPQPVLEHNWSNFKGSCGG